MIGVADCSQASQTGDARDKFFVQPVPEFDPRASARRSPDDPFVQRGCVGLRNGMFCGIRGYESLRQTVQEVQC